MNHIEIKNAIREEIIKNIDSIFEDIPPIQQYKNQFIIDHEDEFEHVAQEMIDDFEEEEALDELVDPEPSVVREYMENIINDIENLPGYFEP